MITGNKTSWFMRVTEGVLTMSDKINQAYINSIFPVNYILSGSQFMAFKADMKKDVQRIINGAGYIVFPMIFSLCLPVFLYNIVLEKESRLLQNMKINGLQMQNYWFVTFMFNFVTHLVCAFTTILFGRYVFRLNFFLETTIEFLAIAIFGWGLNLVSLAFLISVFFESS